MQPSWIRNLMLSSGLAVMLPGMLAAADRSQPEKLETAAQVKELFRVRCFECHGGSRTAADVRILDRELLVSPAAGGNTPGWHDALRNAGNHP